MRLCIVSAQYCVTPTQLLRHCCWDCTAPTFNPLLVGNFGPLASRTHTSMPALHPDCSPAEIQTRSKALCYHSVALRCLCVAQCCLSGLLSALSALHSLDQENFLQKIIPVPQCKNLLDDLSNCFVLLSWKSISCSQSMCLPNAHRSPSYNLLVE